MLDPSSFLSGQASLLAGPSSFLSEGGLLDGTSSLLSGTQSLLSGSSLFAGSDEASDLQPPSSDVKETANESTRESVNTLTSLNHGNDKSESLGTRSKPSLFSQLLVKRTKSRKNEKCEVLQPVLEPTEYTPKASSMEASQFQKLLKQIVKIELHNGRGHSSPPHHPSLQLNTNKNNIVPVPVKAFEFDTPSPDDIVEAAKSKKEVKRPIAGMLIVINSRIQHFSFEICAWIKRFSWSSICSFNVEKRIGRQTSRNVTDKLFFPWCTTCQNRVLQLCKFEHCTYAR